ITPDGKKVVSGSSDKTLKIWHLETGKEISTLTCHTFWVATVSIAPNGKTVISGSYDNTLKLWNLETETLISTFTGDTSIVCCAISPDGLTVVAGEQSGRVHFLRLEGGLKNE
ncbi:MAG: WD40 repeat domain-containing protein, partial [Sphaerospermopsis kisseleviana]